MKKIKTFLFSSLLVCAVNVHALNNNLMGAASGIFLDNASERFPLIAETKDSGATWHYPRDIFSDLSVIDPDLVAAELVAVACAGKAANIFRFCIAPGSYSTAGAAIPLLAVGRQQATGWWYPRSIYENPKISIAADFTSGILTAAGCTGSGRTSFCIATGTYFNNTTNLPLLAQSSDYANTWVYPAAVHENLTTAIAPDFAAGSFHSASCSKSTRDTVCIASGTYCTSSLCHPLIVQSPDKGVTWHYPASAWTDLTTQILPAYAGGGFESSSCTGSGAGTICATAGAFSTASAVLPLVGVTQNGGASWFYPKSIFMALPARIGHEFIGGLFNGVSCTGSGPKTVCMAAGILFRQGANRPLLAVSRDAGTRWDYPDFIYTKLKTLVDPQFYSGSFYGASCSGKGKEAYCVAAGIYCRDKGCNFANPLIATSIDGGKSWQFPASVYTDLTAKIDPLFELGYFRSVSCSGEGADSFCIATGQYSNGTSTRPLLAVSHDRGLTWDYPTAIFTDLTTQISPDFSIGVFNGAGTTGGALFKNFGLKNRLEKTMMNHRTKDFPLPKQLP